MAEQLPFRTCLANDTPAEDEAYLRHLRIALEPRQYGTDALREAAASDSETIIYSLATNQRAIQPQDKSVRRDIVLNLAYGALERAQAEGIVWTPVIDELVSQGLWDEASWPKGD